MPQLVDLLWLRFELQSLSLTETFKHPALVSGTAIGLVPQLVHQAKQQSGVTPLCPFVAGPVEEPAESGTGAPVDVSGLIGPLISPVSVCPSPVGSLGLRYHVKTRELPGSSFSQLGLEPNQTGLTAQSLFFLEESCRVKRSDTQTFSNY